MSIESSLTELIRLAYDAAAEPVLWPEFLDTLAGVLNGRCCWLMYYDAMVDETATIATAKQDAAFEQLYLERFRNDIPWTEQVSAHFDEGTVRTLSSFVPESVVEASAYYQEWMAPQDLHYMLGICLTRSDDLFTGIRLFRSKAAGEFTSEEIELVQALVPHATRAVRLQQRLLRLELERDAARAALDCFDVGAVILDSDGCPVHMNRAASRIVGQHDGLYATRVALRAEQDGDNSQLQQLMFDAASGTGVGGAMRIQRSNGHRPLHVVISRLSKVDGQPGSAEAMSGNAVVFISDPDAGTDTLETTLERMFGLTPTEARIASLLVEGAPIQAVAEKTKTSVGTARSHLKRIFRKTDTNRQSELVRVLLRGTGIDVTSGK